LHRSYFSLISALCLSTVTFTDVLAQPVPAAPTKATCPVIKSLSFQQATKEPYPCDTTSTLPAAGALTANVVSTVLAGGWTMYTVRVKMHTPEDNRTACNVRQYRFNFPLLSNWLAADANDTPTVQITLESPCSQGNGDGMVLYSMERDVLNGMSDRMSDLIIDAGTPNAYQSPLDYYANITVLGTPVK
jgi:hypothetical protein